MEEQSKVPDIGEVHSKRNDLRRKMVGSLAWVDLEPGTKIYPGDKVFTGPESVAQLNLLDLAEVGMSSSTLLIVDPNSLTELDLKAGLGSFTVKLSGNLQKAKVKLNDSVVELNGKGAEVQVSGMAGSSTVTAMTQGVSFRTADGKLVSLGPNQMIGMDRNGKSVVVNLAVKLLSPAVREEVVIHPKSPITFKWKVLVPGTPLSLEFSQTPDFKKVFFKKRVSGDQESIVVDPLKQGTVYWRMVEPGKEEYFYAQAFEFRPLTPPTIFEPVFQHNYTVIPTTGQEFTWEKKFDFTYEGEIQQLDGGIAGSQKFKRPFPNYLAKNLAKGAYQFKIRAVKNGKYTDWTEWRPFTVGAAAASPLELIAPTDFAKAALIPPAKEIIFQWKGGAGQTQIQIASDPDFKNIISEGASDQHTYRWKPTYEGKFHWRVRGTGQLITNARTFSVSETRLAIIEPRDSLSFQYDKPGVIPLNFSWNDVSLANEYTLEFSETNDFKKIVHDTVLNATTYQWNIPKQPQTLYWRVRTAFQKSSPRIIKVAPKPEPVKPMKAPIIESLVRVRVKPDKTFVNKPNPSGIQGPDYIEIYFPQIEKATTYYFEVYSDPYGRHLLHSAETKLPLYKWDNPPVGEYYWGLSFTDGRKARSPTSAFSRLIILPKLKDTNSGKPYFPTPTPKPTPTPYVPPGKKVETQLPY